MSEKLDVIKAQANIIGFSDDFLTSENPIIKHNFISIDKYLDVFFKYKYNYKFHFCNDFVGALYKEFESKASVRLLYVFSRNVVMNWIFLEAILKFRITNKLVHS